MATKTTKPKKEKKEIVKDASPSVSVKALAGKKPVKKAVKKAEKEVKEVKAVKPAKAKTLKKTEKTADAGRYFEAVGRRKTSVARVRLFSKGAPGAIINEKKIKDYFPTEELRRIVGDPLKKMKLLEKFKVTVKVSGGGIHSQAEAVRHGIARALVKFNADFRKRLKKAEFLTRDSRAKERRKFGLKKARKAAQWRKR